MAIASLVLGIVWLAGLGSLLAVIFGFVGNGQIKRSEGREGGKGLAITGIVLGFLGMATWVLLLLFLISVPTFLGARTRAQDRVTQSSLRNAVTSAKAIYTDHEDYTEANVASLSAAEPSLTFVDASTPSSMYSIVSVSAPSPNTFIAAARSASGRCWYIRDEVRFGEGTNWNATSTDICTADSAPTDGWSRTPSLAATQQG